MTKHRAFEAFFVTTALVLTAPFAVSTVCLAGLAVLAGLRSMSVAVPLPWIVSFDGPHTAVARLFADPTRYVVYSFLALLLLLVGLIDLAVRSRRDLISRPQFYLLALGITCVLGFAWLHPYEPAVRPAPSAQLQMVQAPDLVTGIVRRNQVSAEIESCAFEVLGWVDAGFAMDKEVRITKDEEVGGTCIIVRAVPVTITWRRGPGVLIGLTQELASGFGSGQVGPGSLEEAKIHGEPAALVRGVWNAQTQT